LCCCFKNSIIVYYYFSKLFSYYFLEVLIGFTMFHLTGNNFSTNNENYI